VEHDTELENSNTDKLSSSFSLRPHRVAIAIEVFDILVFLFLTGTRSSRDIRSLGNRASLSITMSVVVVMCSILVSMSMSVGSVFVVRVYHQLSSPIRYTCGLTVVNTELGKLLGSDPVCSDLCEEDSIDCSHGNCGCPIVIVPSAR
jgi:hypothetical protein